MDVHSEYVESPLSFENINHYYRAEDSGYTSFTPGSLEPNLSNDFLNQSLIPRTAYIDVTPEFNFRFSRRCSTLKPRNDISSDTPRRGIKRPYPGPEISVSKQGTTIPTPTTLIAGKIESLEVNEDKENSIYCEPGSPQSNKSTRFALHHRLIVPEQILPYPNTPVKRNCKLSPCRSVKKLDFSMHTLSCKKHELQPVPENVAKIQILQPCLARINQKIDIISLLHDTSASPAIKTIFHYLNNEDSYNFRRVCKSWCKVWHMYSSKQMQDDLRKYMMITINNQENCAKDGVKPVRCRNVHAGYLKDIHNQYEINEKPANNVLLSPPCSPKSNRFRIFIKSASLDSKLQLPCVRCSLPAKVTEEITGEEWVECTNAMCLYQFCRSCKCSRHPGKNCDQYGLNAPSPSKRKKCEYAVGTMKSRNNLRRL